MLRSSRNSIEFRMTSPFPILIFSLIPSIIIIFNIKQVYGKVWGTTHFNDGSLDHIAVIPTEQYKRCDDELNSVSTSAFMKYLSVSLLSSLEMMDLLSVVETNLKL